MGTDVTWTPGTSTCTISNSSGTGLTISPGDTLTINSGVQLVVSNSGALSEGIDNSGTITNYGTITVSNSGGENTGITNSGTITNYGTITVSNSYGTGIYNFGPINNNYPSMDINPTLVTITVSNSYGTGIYNALGSTSVAITNDGTITVSNSDGEGIVNTGDGVISNYQYVYLQNSGMMGSTGIYNEGMFTNYFLPVNSPTGNLVIELTSGNSLIGFANAGGTLNNGGGIVVTTGGGSTPCGCTGIYNEGGFTNTDTGQISVSSFGGSFGIENCAPANSGTLNCGSTQPGTFTNEGDLELSDSGGYEFIDNGMSTNTGSFTGPVTETTWTSMGNAVVPDQPFTNTMVSILASSDPDMTDIFVTSQSYGSTPPATGGVTLLGSTDYYDVQIGESCFTSPGGCGVTGANVCIASAGATSMAFYDSSVPNSQFSPVPGSLNWYYFATISFQDGTICGDTYESYLGGTPIAVGGPVGATCTPADVNVGKSTTCSVTVVGTTTTPTGKVSWSASGPGKFSSETCKLNGNGTCSVRFTPTSGGSHVTITASYAGDSHNPSSVGAFTLTVAPRTSTTRVSCGPTSVVAGSTKTIKCTAFVTGYHPTGSITWSQSSTNGGSVTLATLSCTLVNGRCSITMTGTTAGTVIIQAAYGGDTNNLPSSNTRTLTIK